MSKHRNIIKFTFVRNSVGSVFSYIFMQIHNLMVYFRFAINILYAICYLILRFNFTNEQYVYYIADILGF